VAPLDEEELNRVYSPILSPLIWDLGHIANFEDLWLVQTIGGREPLRGDLGRLYDALENPRRARGELPILRSGEVEPYMAAVRERTLEVLDEVELADTDDPLLRDGFVYELLLAHEHQHTETILQLLQLVERYEPLRRDPGPGAEAPIAGPEMVLVEEGEHQIGAPPGGFAYDNERPAQRVHLAGFWIDRAPVTNGDYLAFVEETGAEPPAYWARDGGGGWVRSAMGRTEPLDPAHPVVHVSWHDADAFARWAGKRLPTEQEWEAACAGASAERANLDQLAFGTAPAGAYGDAPSACGAVQMLGDVWEWTCSDFLPYPGFVAFPYREYSEVFFGDAHKVLRGGAWASRRNAIRPSFRNWDLPERRQLFAGIRCARDA
jgi:iron(II)-dependent oxidoreductase